MKMNWLCKRFTIFLGVPLPTPYLLEAGARAPGKDNRSRSGSVAARPRLPDTVKIACEVEQTLVRSRGPRCACSLALCLHFVRLCGLSRAVRKYQNILITLACHQKGIKCKKFSNVLDGVSFCALFHTSFFLSASTSIHRRTDGRTDGPSSPRSVPPEPFQARWYFCMCGAQRVPVNAEHQFLLLVCCELRDQRPSNMFSLASSKWTRSHSQRSSLKQQQFPFTVQHVFEQNCEPNDV